MNNYDVFNLVTTIAGRDEEGQYQFDKFNTLLIAENRNKFDYELRRYNHDWKARLSLRPFLEETDGDSLEASGSVEIASDYAHIVEMRIQAGKFIEIVDEGGWYDRLSSVIKAPTEKHPIARFTSFGFEVRPTSINAVDIWYLRYPTDPYLDGYVNSDGNFVYVEEGGNDENTSAELISGNTGTSNSQTVELEWSDEDKIEIASRILADMGIAHNRESLFSYAQNMKQED